MSVSPAIQSLPAAPVASHVGERLPSGLSLLCVGSTEPSWVGLTLQLDARGSAEPRFRWVSTPADALVVLRDESFDCLLLRYQPVWDPSGEDPLSLARAVRAGGCLDPIVVVTQIADDDAWSEALAINVDLLVAPAGWESAALVPMIERAIFRGQMQANLDRMAATERQRLLRDQNEAEILLAQQMQIVAELESLAASPAESPADDLSPESRSQSEHEAFGPYYQELLRGYVMMSSGRLTAQVRQLAEVLVEARLPPRRVLQLHLHCLSRLVEGLGSRSSRHVLARANLLALELLLHVAEVESRR